MRFDRIVESRLDIDYINTNVILEGVKVLRSKKTEQFMFIQQENALIAQKDTWNVINY